MEPGDLGERLLAARKRRGGSLRELARQAGLSAAALSAVEKGQSSPTLATLHKLLKALGTNFSHFFADSPGDNESPVFPAKRMRTVADAHRRYVLLLPRQADVRFEMLHETISPAEKQSEWEVHDCDLGGVVLQGRGRLEIDGGGEWPLRKGDAFYVRAGLRHRAVNTGRGPLKQITVWYPPRY